MYKLVSAEAGLPPNTKVKIELQKASDDFLLMKQSGDTENYKLKITNICLYIPVAQLSSAVFQELNNYMTRKNDPQPVGIHYRRTEVRPITFPKNKQEYFSDGLFTDSEMPCRICLCFVETKSKIGDMEKNPYNMRRSWTIDVSESESLSSAISPNEKLLEEKLKNIEKQFQEFQEQQNKILEAILNEKGKSKGKGKGKRSVPEPSNQDFRTAVEEEAQRRLRSFISRTQNQESTPSTSTSYEPSAPPPPSIASNWTEDESHSFHSIGLKATKTIYIKKVEVTLNGIPLDLVEDKETEDQCMQAYWRLYTFNGMQNSNFTCGISYDDFRNGFFFLLYDLSTSGKSGSNYVVPSIRVGNLRVSVQFSEGLPIDLTMLMYCEFPSVMYLTKSGKLSHSF